jgi:hypothetical protein
VVIGTLFGSAYNSDRKLITFSDSVQDAAHRAGFFGARTFRNTLRTALAQYLETQGNGQSLDQVVSGFQRHWRNQLGSDADYIATFMPTDMQWLGEWEALLNTGKVAPRLLEFIDQRLHWEIIADAGLRSTIGRSLEQVGACSIGLHSKFGSAYNSDRKLITFSDSVQDAAHRAGFFGARTFRNTLRTALAQYLETQGNGQSLDQVVSGFQRHWRNQLGSMPTISATFMPTDMQWLGEWEALLNTGKVAPRLLEFIDQRLHWEIIADAGLRSTIGRSLEQVGACSIGLHSNRAECSC